MNDKRQIDFKDLMNLGFKREYVTDSVYEKQYGTSYFITSLTFGSNSFDWCQNTRIVTLMKLDKEGTILLSKEIESLGELCFFVEFLNPKTKKFDLAQVYKCC
jgi:hypothetical protein